MEDFKDVNSEVKRRQNMIGFGIVIALFVLIMVGMSLSNNEATPTEQQVANKRHEQIVQLDPNSSMANPAQVWMAKSANQLDAVQGQVKQMQNQMDAFQTQEQERLKLMQSLEERNKELSQALENSNKQSKAVENDSTVSEPKAVNTSQVMAQPFAPAQAQPQPMTIQNQYIAPANGGQAFSAAPNSYPPGTPNAITTKRSGGVIVGELKKTSTTAETSTATDKPVRPKVNHFIGPGGFTKATILGGGYAPTSGNAMQNPAPLLFWVSDLSQLPNEFQSDLIKGCFVLGNMTGNKTTERANVRLMTASCVDEQDNEVIARPVTGYVLGEDAMEGIRGQMIVRSGDALSMAIMADIVGGFGRQLQFQAMQTQMTPFGTTSTIDPGKALESGAGAGFGQAAQRLSQYYIRLAEDLFPVIEINAGREVHLVFTRGVDLDGEYDDSANSNNNNRAQSILPLLPTAAQFQQIQQNQMMQQPNPTIQMQR